MNGEPKQKTVNLDTASKSEVIAACKALVIERDTWRREAQNLESGLVLRNRALAALVRKYDRGAIDGPDNLLVSASLDLPAFADLRLGDNIIVDIVGSADGTGRVVVQRQAVKPPTNGDGMAHPPVLGADGRPA